MNNLELVRQERGDQINNGRTVAEDAQQIPQLLAAAAAYLNPNATPDDWPWRPDSFKPRTTFENVKRAAALCIAAMDAMDFSKQVREEVSQEVMELSVRLEKKYGIEMPVREGVNKIIIEW